MSVCSLAGLFLSWTRIGTFVLTPASMWRGRMMALTEIVFGWRGISRGRWRPQSVVIWLIKSSFWGRVNIHGISGYINRIIDILNGAIGYIYNIKKVYRYLLTPRRVLAMLLINAKILLYIVVRSKVSRHREGGKLEK